MFFIVRRGIILNSAVTGLQDLWTGLNKDDLVFAIQAITWITWNDWRVYYDTTRKKQLPRAYLQESEIDLFLTCAQNEHYRHLTSLAHYSLFPHSCIYITISDRTLSLLQWSWPYM